MQHRGDYITAYIVENVTFPEYSCRFHHLFLEGHVTSVFVDISCHSQLIISLLMSRHVISY